MPDISFEILRVLSARVRSAERGAQAERLTRTASASVPRLRTPLAGFVGPLMLRPGRAWGWGGA